MHAESVRRIRDVVANRMKAVGMDPSPASVVAATLAAVVVQVNADHCKVDSFGTAIELYEVALAAVGATLSQPKHRRAIDRRPTIRRCHALMVEVLAVNP